MKAILEFDLETDRFQLMRAINGNAWAQVVYDLDETFRRELKYTEGLSDEQRACYEQVREVIREEMLCHNLDFDE
jgi:hypothetical protein